MTPRDIVRATVEAVNAGEIEKALGYYSDSVQILSPDPNGPGMKERRGKDVLRGILEHDVRGPAQAQFLQRTHRSGHFVG